MISFNGLMISKYLQLKTGLSNKEVRSQLMQIHETHVLDERTTGQTRLMQMNTRELANLELTVLLKPVCTH